MNICNVLQRVFVRADGGEEEEEEEARADTEKVRDRTREGV